jgi:hypothetical protein
MGGKLAVPEAQGAEEPVPPGLNQVCSTVDSLGDMRYRNLP